MFPKVLGSPQFCLKIAKAWSVVLNPVCAARRKKGGQCIIRTIFPNGRCRYHGGLSTGPKTADGRERIAAAQRIRWSQFRDDRELKKL